MGGALEGWPCKSGARGARWLLSGCVGYECWNLQNSKFSLLTSNSHFFQDKKKRHHISSKWSCHLITDKVITQHKTTLAPPYFTSSFSKNISISLKNTTSQGKNQASTQTKPKLLLLFVQQSHEDRQVQEPSRNQESPVARAYIDGQEPDQP